MPSVLVVPFDFLRAVFAPNVFCGFGEGVMKIQHLATFVVALTACVLSTSAGKTATIGVDDSLIVGSFGDFFGYAAPREPIVSVDFQIGYGDSEFPESPTLFFENIAGDGVFILDTGADFHLATHRITDGIDDPIFTKIFVNPGGYLCCTSTARESVRLFGFPPGPHIDLQGNIIDQLILTVSDFESGTTGNFSSVSFNWNVDVATVPLPGALPLFGVALGILSLSNWWRRRRTRSDV